VAAVRLDQWAVRSPEPVAAQTGEGLALLSAERNRYLVLNESAAAVWERLAGPIQLQALAEAVAGVFGITTVEAGEAVLDVVAHFLDQNIVSVQDEPF
jgi:hypothetical protein